MKLYCQRWKCNVQAAENLYWYLHKDIFKVYTIPKTVCVRKMVIKWLRVKLCPDKNLVDTTVNAITDWYINYPITSTNWYLQDGINPITHTIMSIKYWKTTQPKNLDEKINSWTKMDFKVSLQLDAQAAKNRCITWLMHCILFRTLTFFLWILFIKEPIETLHLWVLKRLLIVPNNGIIDGNVIIQLVLSVKIVSYKHVLT